MATADDDENTGGSSSVRSPRYPSVPLADAVAKIKAIYDADKTAGTPVASAFKHMGYKGKSGPATAALGALKRFGLVEKRGARLFPTSGAVAILRLPENDPRRKKALEEAVLSPEMYRELYDRYHETGLPSAESLEHELILSNRFNHNVIPGFVSDFFASLKYAGLTDENGVLLTQRMDGPEDDEFDEDDDVDATLENPQNKQRKGGSDLPASGPYISFPLSNGNVVEIRLRQRVSTKDFERIKTLVELSEASLVENEDDGDQ